MSPTHTTDMLPVTRLHDGAYTSTQLFGDSYITCQRRRSASGQVTWQAWWRGREVLSATTLRGLRQLLHTAVTEGYFA